MCRGGCTLGCLPRWDLGRNLGETLRVLSEGRSSCPAWGSPAVKKEEPPAQRAGPPSLPLPAPNNAVNN